MYAVRRWEMSGRLPNRRVEALMLTLYSDLDPVREPLLLRVRIKGKTGQGNGIPCGTALCTFSEPRSDSSGAPFSPLAVGAHSEKRGAGFCALS